MEKELNFRKNLRILLDARGVSVKELAELTGLPKRSIENYLGVRESIPPVDYAYKIAKALHVSVEYLIAGDREILTSGGFAMLKNIASDSKEYKSIDIALSRLTDRDKKLLLDIITAVIKSNQ